MKNIYKLNSKSITFLFFAYLSVLTANTKVSFAEISADSFCLLTIAEMQLHISNYQELIILANQYKENSTVLVQQESLKRAKFDQEKEDRHSSFDITAQEFVLYMGKMPPPWMVTWRPILM
jgi:hypothetical protein